MKNNKTVKKGDTVQVIISVWREDETPTFQNFYTGKVLQIVERTKHCFYVRVSGLDKLIPIDRVTA